MTLMTNYDAKCKQHDHGKLFGEHKRQWQWFQTLFSGVGKCVSLLELMRRLLWLPTPTL